jgi:hypothetical protein
MTFDLEPSDISSSLNSGPAGFFVFLFFFCRSSTEVMSHSQESHGITSTSLGEGNFGLVAKVVSLRFLHGEITVFLWSLTGTVLWKDLLLLLLRERCYCDIYPWDLLFPTLPSCYKVSVEKKNFSLFLLLFIQSYMPISMSFWIFVLFYEL